MNSPDISYVTNKDIDYASWDQCVAGSSTPLVYARSWFLDIVSPGWDALICDNYRFVMPLSLKRKLGTSFLLQPIYAQQQGIFPEPDNELQNRFLALIHQKFSYATIHLHAGHSEPLYAAYSLMVKNNYILDLSAPYEVLKRAYTKHTHKQFKTLVDDKVFVVKGLQSKEFLDLKDSALEEKSSPKTMHTLQRLIEYGHSKGNGIIYAAYTPENILCAAAYFLFDVKRVTYLNAVSTAEGKNMNAMFKIVDQFIREHAGSGLTLDFEGSMIPGIAHFYKRFGAQTEQYYCLKFNKLPLPLRWLKK